MRAVHSIFAALALGGLAAAGLGAADLATAPAVAQETPELPHQQWSWQGPFGTFDLAAAQRGFQVYSEVCSTCHSMKELHYRDLAGIGLTPEQIQAVAAAVTVPQGLDDQGQPKEGPGTPGSQFRSPFPNEQAARAALNGALPPDLSLIVKERAAGLGALPWSASGADYVYDLLTGFKDAPPNEKMPDNSYYNVYFPGHHIAMPPPLSDDVVTYGDGTKATTAQEAHDVVTFLTWAAEPTMEDRKRNGAKVLIFLVVLTGLLYAAKRKIWADVH